MQYLGPLILWQFKKDMDPLVDDQGKEALNFQITVAIAWLVQGVFHLVFHIGHLDGLETADQVGLVGSLVSIPILAAVSLWAGVRAPINNT